MARELITLENGLQLWLEPMSSLRTASFGIWIAAGSSHETKQVSGISHFLEHMFFKAAPRALHSRSLSRWTPSAVR